MGPSSHDDEMPEATASTVDHERLADVQIVQELRRYGLDGPEWRQVASALMEYGYAVLVVWGCAGTLGRHAADHGGVSGRRVPVDLRLDEDDARALAGEVLVATLEKFRTRSLQRWHPAGGASLRTYFIGRCLMELADVYDAWYAREVRPFPLDRTHIDDGRFDGRYGGRPDEQAEARVLTDQVLDRDPELCRALMLLDEGYTLDEIAKRMGTTRHGVRSKIYRGRRRFREEGLG